MGLGEPAVAPDGMGEIPTRGPGTWHTSPRGPTRVTGLSLDVQVRTLVVHQADGFRERGMSLSFGWDPTPSSPMGLNARIRRRGAGRQPVGPRRCGTAR